MPAPASKSFLLLVIIGLITITAGCSESVEPRLFHSSSGYKLHIQTDEPLSNVTFYIPLPVKNGTPVVGAAELTPGVFERNNFSIEIRGVATRNGYHRVVCTPGQSSDMVKDSYGYNDPGYTTTYTI